MFPLSILTLAQLRTVLLYSAMNYELDAYIFEGSKNVYEFGVRRGVIFSTNKYIGVGGGGGFLFCLLGWGLKFCR